MTVMTETPGIPAEERRGTGQDGFDWGTVRPGGEFPDDDPEPDATNEQAEIDRWQHEEAPDDSCRAGDCEDDRDLRDGLGVSAGGGLHRRVGIGWHWCGHPGCGGD